MAQDELNVGGLMTSQFNAVKQYAADAFKLAEEYINDLNGYIVGTISTIPPAINIDVPTSIDPTVIGEIPVAPENYPSVPNAPGTSDHAFPNAPTYTLPTVPTLHDIVLPEFFDRTIQPSTMALPVLDFDFAAINQIQDGGLTTDDNLVPVVRTKLQRNIDSGGTMLDPQVETDLWNRDLERNEQALQDAIDKLTAQWAKLGWSVPDGLLAGSLLGVNNEYMNKRLDLSRLIAVEQAKLEQAGMFKSLEIAVSLEQILIGNMNDYAKRVFETSKATADVTVAIFRERVNMYNASLTAFKTDVDAYKVRVEAESLRAEVYKARLSGMQIIAGIDETNVKIYTAEIGALQQMTDVYKTNVQAVAVMYEAEKQKIEMFKTQVDAYAAEVKSITEQYAAQVEGFKAYLSAWVASSDSQTKLIDVGVRAQIATVEATIKEWEVQLKLIQENVALKLEALKAVAQTASNVAAGALSAAHASASLGFQGSTSYNQNIDLTPNA